MAYRNRYAARVVEDSRIIRPPQSNRPSGLRAPQVRIGSGIPSLRTGTTGIARPGQQISNAPTGLPKPQIRRPVLVTPTAKSGIPSGIRRLVPPTMISTSKREKSPPPSRLQPRTLEFNRTQAPPIHTSPVYASPVHASPVRASPVRASPVRASPVHTSPVYASPVRGSPVYTSPVNVSPVYATPVRTSPVYASPANISDISQTSPPPELDISQISSNISPANLSNISNISPPPGLDYSGTGSMLADDSFQEAPLVDLSFDQTLNELRAQEVRELRDLEDKLRAAQDTRRNYYMHKAMQRSTSPKPMNPYTKLLLQRIEEYGGYVPDMREEEPPEVLFSEEMEEELDPLYEWNLQPYASGAQPASVAEDLIDMERDPWTYSEELYRLVRI